MAKKVSVTSVTPASKVKASPKTQQDRTRKAIGVAVGGLPAVAAMAIMNRKKDSKKATPKEVAERTRMVSKIKRTADLVAPGAKPKSKEVKPKPKAPAKKKIEMMPDKINPSKMTPAQKARFLKNPERYNY